MSKFDVDWEHLAFASDAGEDFAGSYLTATAREEADGVRRIREAVEQRMSGRSIRSGGHYDSVRGLTDAGRAKDALPTPVTAGTRVRFHANAGTVLSYPDPPGFNAVGTVVAVKTAGGPVTAHDGMVFVRWEDETIRPIHAEHLRLAGGRARQGTHRMRVASLGDLTDFLKVAEDRLVHKATRDLWAVKQDGQEYVIERLFAESGEPIKV